MGHKTYLSRSECCGFTIKYKNGNLSNIFKRVGLPVLFFLLLVARPSLNITYCQHRFGIKHNIST